MLKEFSATTRQKNLKIMKEQVFDLVIVGGGITGAGVAREAASRGMKVALVEMDDFASGTSSRSSKLIHGGIRYLEHLEFHLVYEALSERSLLFEMAPHLVHPLRFVMPVYKGSRVSPFKLGLGMWLYDILSLFEAPELHERLDARQSLVRLPMLKFKNLEASFVYSDAYMDDDRLVLETLRSASDLGAVCANYVKSIGADFKDEKLEKICCRDVLSGHEFYIKAKHFVSTVGPWTDVLASQLLTSWQKIMRPSKGVHLTFSRERFPLESAVVMGMEKRIVFGIPRHDMVIVGTTDNDFSGDPAEVCTTEEDVEYLLKVVSNYFPGAQLKREDILSSYAGVRPLVDDGSKDEGSTSREHLILNDPRNITFVAGGKYTTYRKMAEEVVDSVLSCFSLESQAIFCHGDTKTPINPLVTIGSYSMAVAQAEQWAIELDIALEQAQILLERHGLEVESMLKYQEHNFLEGEVRVWGFELLHAIENTMCLTLRDFYLRRTPLFLSRSDHGLSWLDELGALLQSVLKVSDDELAKQKREIEDHLNTELSWQQTSRA